MKILITGGNGFIGSHLVVALARQGKKVVVVDRGAPRADINWGNVEYVVGDFSDRSLVRRAAAGCDMIFHLASTSVPGTANKDPASDIKGNLLGSLELIESMREVGCRRIVYLSSGGTVYGDPPRGLDLVSEDVICAPISSYGIVKAAVERYLLMAQRTIGIQPIILRASNPYGPRQGRTGIQGLIGTAISQYSRGEAVGVWGDGSAVRDYLYIDDLIELMLATVSSSATGVFNAGSGTGTTVLEALSCVARVMGCERRVDFMPSRAFDVARIVLDVDAARQEFGWSPSTPLELGIEKTVKSFNQGARPLSTPLQDTR